MLAPWIPIKCEVSRPHAFPLDLNRGNPSATDNESAPSETRSKLTHQLDHSSAGWHATNPCRTPPVQTHGYEQPTSTLPHEQSLTLPRR
jgi:hypothetical protein